jgi:hypothetical protein
MNINQDFYSIHLIGAFQKNQLFCMNQFIMIVQLTLAFSGIVIALHGKFYQSIAVRLS